MSQTVCPNCGNAFERDENEKTLTCPSCGHVFDVQEEAQETPVTENTVTEAEEPESSDVKEESEISVSETPSYDTAPLRKLLLSSRFGEASRLIMKEDPSSSDPSLKIYRALASMGTGELSSSELRQGLRELRQEYSDGSISQKEYYGKLKNLYAIFTNIIRSHIPGKNEKKDMDVSLVTGIMNVCNSSLQTLSENDLKGIDRGNSILSKLFEAEESLITSAEQSLKGPEDALPSSFQEIRETVSSLNSSINEKVRSSEKADEQRNSREAVKAYFDEHKDQERFLSDYIKKNRVGRIVFIAVAAVLFIALMTGAIFALKALVKGGISYFGYIVSIAVIMLFIIIFWLLFSIFFRKMNFKGQTIVATKLYQRPIGKEEAIQKFIENRTRASEVKENQAITDRTSHLIRVTLTVIAILIIVFLLYNYMFYPFFNLKKGMDLIDNGKGREAIPYLQKAGDFSTAKDLLKEQLKPLIEQAIKYEGIMNAYNNYFAVRTNELDIQYLEYSSPFAPDVALTNSDSFIMLQDYIVALRPDGEVSYSQYTRVTSTEPPQVSSWIEVASLDKMDNAIVGFQTDGSIIFNLTEVSQETIDRLTASDIKGIYDRMAVFGIKENGTVSLPDAEEFGYPDRVRATFDEVSKWSDMVMIKGDITNFILGLTADGRVYAAKGWFEAEYGELNVSSWRNIVDIAAGEHHSVGLKSDGTVVATGSNAYGQCEVSEWTDIVAIAAGNNFTMGVTSDGTVYVTGHEDTTFTPRGLTQACVLEIPEDEYEDEGEEGGEEYASSEIISSEIASSDVPSSEPVSSKTDDGE